MIKNDNNETETETKEIENMQTDQYRIDRACHTVYEYSAEHKAYLYLCNFLSIGARGRNRDKTIIKKIEEWKASD